MNLQDVARRAGVSTATVSRVINNLGVVSKGTRAKVLKAIEESRYLPNLHARALAGASRTFGLIVSNLENPFFLDIFHYLDLGAHEHGYDVLVANTGYDRVRLESSLGLMLGRRPAGIAVVVSEMDDRMLDELSSRNIRAVTYDATSPRPGIAVIRTNYNAAMKGVVEYLYSLGHRRMAFLGHHTALGPLNERQRAFIDLMEGYGGQVEFEIATSDDSLSGGRAAARELFQSGFRPTAIVCVNDFTALGVLAAARDLKLRIPEDLSVTGFDNITLSEVAFPPLTTVNIARDLIAKEILARLIGGNAEDHLPDEVVLKPELLVRASTGPFRG